MDSILASRIFRVWAIISSLELEIDLACPIVGKNRKELQKTAIGNLYLDFNIYSR